MNAIKQILIKYRHGLLLSYGIVYMIWFTALERAVTTEFHPVYMKLDDYIPFWEIFIVPYYLWFLYIAITIAYFLLTSKRDYYRYCANLFIGMTIALIIYTIWPNGHHLRVDLTTLGRENIFTSLVSKIYTIDTPTNVFPSLHVYNSIAAFIAIRKSERLQKIKWIQWSSLILSVTICLSTVFLKQHSVADLFGALLLNVIMYVIVYIPTWDKETRKAKEALSKAS